MAYDLREGTCKDYSKLLFPEKLPRAARVVDRLYSVEVLERRDGRVKIHYIGYDSKYDEWRKEDEIVCPSNEMSRNLDSSGASALQLESYIPFDHHRELAYSIKTALNSSQKNDPMVLIELPFDLLQFNGGLKLAGTFLRTFRGNEIYGIQKYGDLAPFLGPRWYIRGLNSQLDFCAVKKETVNFHLLRKPAVVDFLSATTQEKTPGGYVLVLRNYTPVDFHELTHMVHHCMYIWSDSVSMVDTDEISFPLSCSSLIALYSFSS